LSDDNMLKKPHKIKNPSKYFDGFFLFFRYLNVQ
jgi:hypothetical protein